MTASDLDHPQPEPEFDGAVQALVVDVRKREAFEPLFVDLFRSARAGVEFEEAWREAVDALDPTAVARAVGDEMSVLPPEVGDDLRQFLDTALKPGAEALYRKIGDE